MKNKKLIPLLLVSIYIFTTSCNKEHPLTYENDPAIYFDNYIGLNSNIPISIDSIAVSFMDIPEDEYTITVRVITQGMLNYDKDRYFNVRQKAAAPEDKNYDKAVSGVDFVALDDASVSSQLFIPAGERYGYIPITILKSDNVTSGKVELTLELTESDEFRLGMKNKLTFKVKYSAKPEKPINWDRYWKSAFSASWGPEKHKFIIKTLGAIDWTDETYPLGLMNYWKGVMYNALNTYNTANPDNKLKEAEVDGGALVSFTS